MKKAILKVTLVTLVIGWLIGGAVISAQEKKEHKPTEVQLLRLQVKQKDAQMAQVRFQVAQQAFQASVNELQAEANKVKEQNGWAKETEFNADTLAFLEAPKAPKQPAKVEEKK